jgi:hypothetical protein
MVASGLREAAHSVVPFAAGAPGMLAGAEAGGLIGSAVAPGIGTVAGGIIGGALGAIPGAYVGSKLQESALDAAGLNDTEQRAANRQENPLSSNIGELAPAVATFRIGDLSTKLAQRLLMGAGMGAIDVAQQAAGPNPIDWTEAGVQAAGGALLSKPRGWAEPQAARFSKYGADFAGKYFPAGRPDLSNLKEVQPNETIRPEREPDQTPEQTQADKDAVQPFVRTGDNYSAASQAAPSTKEQPFSGFRVTESAGNKTRQDKDAPNQPPPLYPEGTDLGSSPVKPGDLPEQSVRVVQSMADDPAIQAAIGGDKEPAATPRPEQQPQPQQAQQTPPMYPPGTDFGSGPNPDVPQAPQPAPVAPPRRPMPPVRRPPNVETNSPQFIAANPEHPLAQRAREISLAKAEPPPAATEAAAASKQKAPKQKLSLPEKPAGALKEPPVKEATPQEPASEFEKMMNIFAPKGAEPMERKPRPGRYTNTEVSDKTIKALRATGDKSMAKLANNIDALPPGQEREQAAARTWAAMHSQTGEAPGELKNIRVRNPETYKKLEVDNYLNPATGKKVRTKYASDAIAYSRIHDINDRLLADKKLAPKANETEEQVKDRAQAILGAAKAEAKKEAERMIEEANREGSNLTDADRKNLIEAAKLVGNGKLPVENYEMARLGKPPAWRLQRHAKDFLEGKFPENGPVEPYQKFKGDELLIRGKPEDYAEFEKNNRMEAELSKKGKAKSDIDYAQIKQAARNVAKGQTTEQSTLIKKAVAAEPEAAEETLGERLKREQKEDRVLDKLRSMKYDKLADTLEELNIGPERDAKFAQIEAQLLKTKMQPMARKKIPRPSDSLGYDAANKAILEAGLKKVEEAKAANTESEINPPPQKEVPSRREPTLEEAYGVKATPEGEGVESEAVSPEKPYPIRSAPEYAKALDKRLTEMDSARKNFVQKTEQKLTELRKTHPQLFSPEVYEAKADNRIDDLPADLRADYYMHLKPMEDIKDVLAHNVKEIAPEEMGQLIENHTGRVLLNGPNSAEYQKYLSGRSDDPMLSRNLRVSGRGSMRERAFNGLEYADGPQKGKVQVITPSPEGFAFWNNHKATSVKDPSFTFEQGKAYTAPDGQRYTMVEAPIKAIEDNALLENGQPPQYARNLPLSLARNMRDLVNFGLEHEYFGKMKAEDPEWRAHATTDPKDPRIDKNGWVQTKMPTFKNWYMDKQLAAFLDDYHQPGFHDDAFNWVRQISQGVTKLIYLFPTMHLLNVGGFGFAARGNEWLKPNAYKVLGETSARAMKSVLAQDDLIADLRDKGLTLMSGMQGTDMERLGKAAGQVIRSNSRSFELLAKIAGVPARDFVKNLYDKSSHYMWTGADMIPVQAVLEREAQGMSREAAIAQVEKLIPNYKIGTHFMGSGEGGRFMAKLMADPATMAFGPYHVGVIRFFGDIFNRALKPGTPKERMDALGQLAALAFLGTVVKGGLDKVAQVLTGNEDAEVRPMGPLTIPTNVYRAGVGEKDIGQALRDTFTIPPLANTVTSLLRNQNFAGRSIVQPEDIKEAAHGSPKALGRAALSAAEFTARGLVAPYNLAAGGLTENKQSIPGVIRDQLLGITNPTDSAVKFKNLKAKYDLRARRQEMKSEKDPLKRFYDSVTQ